MAAADQGRDALVITLGREFHQVNAGWIRLLAPHAHRGGMPSPGFDLPLAQSENRDLAFLLYPEQEPYLPLLRRIYPYGTIRRYRHESAGLVVTAYRVGRRTVAQARGALAMFGTGRPSRVPTLGDVPSTLRQFPARLHWVALLRAPRHENLRLRLVGGPATLALDGRAILATRRGERRSIALSLARGRHLVQLDGVARSGVTGPRLEWQVAEEGWRPVAETDLLPGAARTGLLGTVRGESIPEQQRLDPTLADCCLTAAVGGDGSVFTSRWNGTLRAPRTGSYGMSLLAEGEARLVLDGRAILRVASTDAVTTRTTTRLRRGPHLRRGDLPCRPNSGRDRVDVDAAGRT